MPQIEFENQMDSYGSVFDRPKKGLIGLLMKSGIVKTEEHANIVLIAVVAVSILLIIYFAVFKNRVSNDLPPPNIIITEQP